MFFPFFLSLINGSHKASVLLTAAGGANLKRGEKKNPRKKQDKENTEGIALTIISDGGSGT